MADPAVPFSWRCERAKAGSGALGDLGSHAISVARFLGGPIVEVLGDTAMVVPERAVAPPGGDLQFGRVEQPSELRKVENEDIAHCLFRFASGVLGSLTSSRTAWGRKNGPDLELYGTLGAVRYRQERFNEYELFRASARQDDNGYRTVFCGPYHGEYGRFTPAPGHGIGFNDLKVIEVAGLLKGIATGGQTRPGFPRGLGDRGGLRRHPRERRAPRLGPGRAAGLRARRLSWWAGGCSRSPSWRDPRGRRCDSASRSARDRPWCARPGRSTGCSRPAGSRGTA